MRVRGRDGGGAGDWIGTNRLVLIASYQPNWDGGQQKAQQQRHSANIHPLTVALLNTHMNTHSHCFLTMLEFPRRRPTTKSRSISSLITMNPGCLK